MIPHATAAMSSAGRAVTKPAAVLAPSKLVPGREPLLFTPGPLTTSAAVKQAMLVDLGSRDERFVAVVRDVRQRLLQLAGTSKEDGYECVIMQGSGTFMVESVVGGVIPRSGAKLLVLSNGAYGKRMAKIAAVLGIPHELVDYGELGVPSADDVRRRLRADPGVTHVGVIHHETTTGTLNPVEEIGRAVQEERPGACFIVDAMSSFGAYPVDLRRANITYLVSSSNKCIEGVPGFAFALCQREHLSTTAGFARSLSLDLHDQWRGLDSPMGQFRFTPPTHALLAFHQALLEHEAEGGVLGRLARYEHNHSILVDGLRDMGFTPYLKPDVQGCIITTFLVPDDARFVFEDFYRRLSARGIVIYPGKLTEADCFRIGSIGRLFDRDMRALVSSVREVLTEMGVGLPVRQKQP